MGQDLIRYDILAQEALRGVIRKVLGEVQKTGLPGEHHFFITFLTSAPGVRVSSRLREKYPELMTIVIQHQYWDLSVTDTAFEIGLSFSDIPERLLVPFAAIRGFYDPAVNFELEFDVRETEAANAPGTDAATPLALAPAVVEELPRPQAPAKLPAAKGAAKDKAPEDAEKADDGEKKKADVVSLDAFRKKTWDSVGEVVNLRQARKRTARERKEAEAQANRVAFGLSSKLKAKTRKDVARAGAKLDGHKLDRQPPTGNDGAN